MDLREVYRYHNHDFLLDKVIDIRAKGNVETLKYFLTRGLKPLLLIYKYDEGIQEKYMTMTIKQDGSYSNYKWRAE